GALVLLDHDQRHAPEHRCQPGGDRRVTAERDDDLRPAPAHDVQRPRDPAHDPPRGGNVGQRQPALDTPAGQLVEGEPGRRHEPRLDPGRAADEVDRCRVVPAGDERAGHREPWQEMTAGAAAGEDGERCGRHLSLRFGRAARAHAHRGDPGAFRATFNRMPAAAIVASNEEPPKEMNGSGTPVIGSTPMTAPMFTNACTQNHDVMPTASIRANGSDVRTAVRTPRKPSNTNSATTSMAPTMPSSSPM